MNSQMLLGSHGLFQGATVQCVDLSLMMTRSYDSYFIFYIFFIFWAVWGTKESTQNNYWELIFESTFGRGYVSSQEGDYKFALA